MDTGSHEDERPLTQDYKYWGSGRTMCGLDDGAWGCPKSYDWDGFHTQEVTQVQTSWGRGGKHWGKGKCLWIERLGKERG